MKIKFKQIITQCEIRWTKSSHCLPPNGLPCYCPGPLSHMVSPWNDADYFGPIRPFIRHDEQFYWLDFDGNTHFKECPEYWTRSINNVLIGLPYKPEMDKSDKNSD